MSYEKLNTYKQIVEEMFESVGQAIVVWRACVTCQALWTMPD